MPLNIPNDHVNHHMTITNPAGGISARSTVAIGYHVTGTYAQADFARITNLIRDGLTPRYDNVWILGPSFGIARFGGALVRFDDTGTEAGTHTAATYVPPAVALVVSKHTGVVGRSFQGRMYMPGVNELAVNEAGIIDGAEVNDWQASMDALHAALLADAAIDQIVLFHDVTSPFAGVPTEVDGFVVRNTVGSMRPRQRR